MLDITELTCHRINNTHKAYYELGFTAHPSSAEKAQREAVWQKIEQWRCQPYRGGDRKWGAYKKKGSNNHWILHEWTLKDFLRQFTLYGRPLAADDLLARKDAYKQQQQAAACQANAERARARQYRQQYYQQARHEWRNDHRRARASGATGTTTRDSFGFSACHTEKDVQLRYRALAKQYHPDVPGGDTETMKRVNAAKTARLHQLAAAGPAR